MLNMDFRQSRASESTVNDVAGFRAIPRTRTYAIPTYLYFGGDLIKKRNGKV